MTRNTRATRAALDALEAARVANGPWPSLHQLAHVQCIDPAEAAWRARDTGSLSLGNYADLIILDRDIFTCNVYDIGDTEVLLTLLGGKEVHRSEKFTGKPHA